MNRFFAPRLATEKLILIISSITWSILMSKLNLLLDTEILEKLISNYLVRLIGLKRITKKFWYRWIASGAEFYDIESTISRTKNLETWCREWCKTAESYKKLAIKSVGHGSLLSAHRFFLKASVYYYLAQWAIFDITDEKQDAYRQSKACFLDAMKYDPIPVQETTIEHEGLQMPGYIRVPDVEGKLPAILFIHGMDSAKEEVYWTEREAVQRGFVTMYFDGPGQGELYILQKVQWQLHFDAAIVKVLDYLAQHPKVDARNLFVCGLSWGGFWALKVAALQKDRIKGCISLGGPPHSDHFHSLPLPIRMRFARLFGSIENSDHIIKEMDIRGLYENIECPCLVIHGKKDPLVPFKFVEDMVNRMRATVDFLVYKDGDHCCTMYAAKNRAYAADWLLDKVNTCHSLT